MLYIDLYNLLPHKSVYEWMKVWEIHIIGKQPESFVMIAVDENQIHFDFHGSNFRKCK